MKYLVVVLVFGINFSFVAQDFSEVNKWSVGLNVGGQDFHSPISTRSVKFYEPTYYNFNARYMLNNRFGVRANLGYHLLLIKDSKNVQMSNISIDAIWNLSNSLRFDTWSKNKFGLLGHVGIGLASMWQRGYYQSLAIKPENPLFNFADDSFAFALGLTPQYKVSEKFSINFEMTFVQHALQTRSFDWVDELTNRGFNANYMKFSLGATFYLGEQSRHADWAPTEYGSIKHLTNESYERKLLQMEQRLMDDDKDGVPNYLDEEPNTIEGSLVNSKGIGLKDSDGDGVPDDRDLCPNEKGLWSMDGCPDSDGDGVPDHKDACPAVPGDMLNKGCPVISVAEKQLLEKAMKGIQFETGKDLIKKTSYTVLDNVAKTFKEHPEWIIEIQGHTDNTGDYSKNKTLSQKRAEAVKKYMENKNVTNKLTAVGYGSDQPKGDNKTAAGRASNRRVEFKITYTE